MRSLTLYYYLNSQVQTSQRAYVLLKEKMKLNVNACVRLPEPVEFDKVVARKKAPIAPPPAAPSRQGPQRAARPQQQEAAAAASGSAAPEAGAREAALLR